MNFFDSGFSFGMKDEEEIVDNHNRGEERIIDMMKRIREEHIYENLKHREG